MNSMTLNLRMLCIAGLLALGSMGAWAADSGQLPPTTLNLQAAPEAAAPAPAAANKISSDTVIMKINGEEIKEGRLDEIMDQMLKNIMARLGPMFNPESLPAEMRDNMRVMAIKQLKDKVLLDQAIAALNYTPTDAEVQAEWDLMETRLKMMKGQDATLKAEIEAAQKQDPTVNEGFIRNNLKEQLQAIRTIEKELKKPIDPKPEEVKEIYDKDPQRWGRMRASHILVMPKQAADPGDAVTVDKAAQERAAEALKEVKAGKDFAELAKKYSDDKGNADKGGDLDFFYYEMMVEPFSEAAFKLKKGETSDLVKTDFGYHIIKAMDYQPLKLDDPKNTLDTRKRIQIHTRSSRMQNSLELAMMELAKKAKIEELVKAPAAEAPAPPPAANEPPPAAKK